MQCMSVYVVVESVGDLWHYILEGMGHKQYTLSQAMLWFQSADCACATSLWRCKGFPQIFTLSGCGRLMANRDYWELLGIYFHPINLNGDY